MKIKHLIIVSLILAIITIGAASAADDSDALAVEDDTGDTVSQVDEVDVVAEGEGSDEPVDPGDGLENEKKDLKMDVDIPDDVAFNDEDAKIDIRSWDNDVTGNITVKIINDDETETVIYNQEIIPYSSGYYDGDYNWINDPKGGNSIIIKDLNLKPGVYNFVVSYDGDDNYYPFTKEGTMNYYIIKETVYETHRSLYIDVINSAEGTVELFIDGNSFRNISTDDMDEGDFEKYYRFDLSSFGFGPHTYKITFNGNYELNEPLEGKLNLTYPFNVGKEFDDEYQTIYLDSNLNFRISYPDDANGEVTITYNGKKITEKVVGDEDGENEIYVTLTDFELGENNITFTYNDPKYPEKSVTLSINAVPRIFINNYQIRYANEEDAISIILPADAKGNLVIYSVGEWNETLEDNNLELIATVPLVNGRANHTLTELGLGYHTIRAVYDNDDYSEYFDSENNQINIVPDVIYDKYVYFNATNSIKVVLPDDFNGNLTVRVRSSEGTEDEETYEFIPNYDKQIYSEIVNGTVTVPLPKLDVGNYWIYVNAAETYASHDFNVMENAPEFDLNVTFPSEITSDDNIIIIENIPEDANGQVELYINGTFYEVISVDDYDEFYFNYNVIGTHTWEIRFTGDSYYKDTSKSGTFLKDWVEVPKEIYNGDEIDVSMDGKEGYIELIIDGKTYKTEFLDEDGDASIELNDLTIGTHTYELNYYDKNNAKQLTKSGSFKTVYYFGTNIDEDDSYSLTNEFKLIIDLPEDATGTVTVTVNGKNFTATPVEGIATIIIDNLEIGENNVTTSYSEDSKYPEDTLKQVINIEGYGIIAEYSGEDSENFEYVTLVLPEDAKGNLSFYRAVWIEGYEDYDDDGDEILIPGHWEIMYDEQVKTVKLENGTIKVTRADFGYGSYDLMVVYESETENYTVEPIDIHFDNEPEVKYPEKIVCGENATISVYIENATGSIKIYSCVGYDEEAEEPIFDLYDTIASDNGKFEKTLTGLPFGEFMFYLEYDGEDMENMFNIHIPHSIEVGVKNVTIPEEFNSDGTGTITFELPEGASGNLTIVDDSTGKVLMENVTYTSANKTIAISGLSTGGHSLKLTYVDDKNGEFVFSARVNVPKPDAGAEVTIPETVSGDSFDIVLPKNATGGILVTIDGNTTYIPLVNGTAKVDLSKLADGTHAVTVKYAGDGNYSRFEKSTNVTVKKPVPVPVDPALELIIANVEEGTPVTITVKTNATFTGQVKISSDVFNTTVEVKNGEGQTTVDLAKGQYSFKAIFNATDVFKASEVTTAFNVTEKSTSGNGSGDNKTNTTNTTVPVKIVANDLTVFYNDGKKYTVTVYGTDGKAAVKTQVVFKINGKKVGSAVTDAKGVATLKITQVPKTYKITAEALGTSITKNLKVKQVLKLQKVKVKRSAKKLVIKVTLKQGKKALGKKKITLKFKGKKYVKKTNKKGVAKFTIKKKVLKKLKKGKKVTYSATYLKDTVKRTVKVKK